MEHILYQRLHFSANGYNLNIWFIIIVAFLTSCTSKEEQNKPDPISDFKVVPAPSKLLYKRGYFQLERTTRLLMNLSDQTSKKVGEYFLEELKEKTKYNIKIADRFTTFKIHSSIEIITENTGLQNLESFKIEVKSDKIKIFAKGETGLFYAINTVVSLLSTSNNTIWRSPQLVIEDSPISTVRALIINIDSLPTSKNTLEQLIYKNRINTIFINTNWVGESEYVNFVKPNVLDTSKENKSLTIKDFYNSSLTLSDSSIYVINSSDQLHPDSLAVLGEAMWSAPSKRNYTKLINALESELRN